MNIDETCRLCGKSRPLRESHITPKFVFRYQRLTSPLTIRSSNNPNRPSQDSRKIRFLCNGCEQLFSKWETAFTREIYNPYHADEFRGARYGPWLSKFAASICWRAARATLEAGDTIPAELELPIKKAELIWRAFLLDEREHPGDFPLYLFFLDSLAEHPKGDVPINFASWVLRGGGAGIWHHPGRCSFAWQLLGAIAVVGIASPPRNLRDWGEHLRIRSGFLPKKRSYFPRELIVMLASQAQDHLQMSRELSEKQKMRDGELLQATDTADATDYFRAMALDVKRGIPKP
jgi:hypothetical protein